MKSRLLGFGACRTSGGPWQKISDSRLPILQWLRRSGLRVAGEALLFRPLSPPFPNRPWVRSANSASGSGISAPCSLSHGARRTAPSASATFSARPCTAGANCPALGWSNGPTKLAAAPCPLPALATQPLTRGATLTPELQAKTRTTLTKMHPTAPLPLWQSRPWRLLRRPTAQSHRHRQAPPGRPLPKGLPKYPPNDRRRRPAEGARQINLQ